MKWFHQHRLGGLGNFVMATPALQLLSKKWQKKIDVYFDAPYIAGLYRKCPFINIARKRPGGKPFATSVRPKRIGKESDSEALCRILLGANHPSMPNTYVDNYITAKLPKEEGKKYVAVFHGCLGGFKPKKDIGKGIRQYILNSIKASGNIPVLLGDKQDIDNFWYLNGLKECRSYLNKLKIQESVSILSQCDYFISNDTGLYHVAGAMKKNGLVLWKNTNPVKNKSIYNGISHCINPEFDLEVYKKAIDNYVMEH